MRRSLAIVLVSLHLFSLFGYLVAFVTARAEIRREIKQRIKQSIPARDLVLIRVTPEEESSLEWIKAFEFRYRGGLYDIVRTEQADDTTLYYCINDVQEERLFAGLDGHVRRQMESDARTSSGPSGARSTEYLPVTGSPGTSPPVVGILHVIPFLLPVPPVQDVPFPPPKLV